MKYLKILQRSNYFPLECFGRFAGKLKFIFFDIFSKVGTYLHLQLSRLVLVFLDKKDLRLIAFVFDLAGQSFSQFRACSHVPRLLFPSFLLALIMHLCIEIQYGRQQIIFSVRKFLPPQQDLFRKDRKCKKLLHTQVKAQLLLVLLLIG